MQAETSSFIHVPVLLNEAVDALQVKANGRYVDGTFGRGGHSREIVRRGGIVLGIDRDDEAVVAGKNLQLKDLSVVKGNHGDLGRIANDYGWEEVDGILLDLGVSSPQLDDSRRGFGFRSAGPLDMRMDRSRGRTAADIVNGEDAAALEAIFRNYGEEPQARRIAQGIVKKRASSPFVTACELADFVEALIGRRTGKHPATRIFQALRMEVNDELGELTRALEDGLRILSRGGRFAVITFESLSDRVVKKFFAAHEGKMRSLQEGGEKWEGELPRVHRAVRHSVVAGERELEENPRSRSARLRVVEKE